MINHVFGCYDTARPKNHILQIMYYGTRMWDQVRDSVSTDNPKNHYIEWSYEQSEGDRMRTHGGTAIIVRYAFRWSSRSMMNYLGGFW